MTDACFPAAMGQHLAHASASLHAASVVPGDTASEAQAVQVAAAWRMNSTRWSPREVMSLSHTLRHPDLDEQGIFRHLVKELHGIEIPAR